MNLLLIETSGLEASLAVADDSGVRLERRLDTAGQRNARLLIPAVDELLSELNWKPTEVDVIAVSVGPGSFTGLRVGIVFAKTFAWVNNARLVAVDTLQGIAQRLFPTRNTVIAVSDAQRGDVFVNSYQGNHLATAVGEVHIEPLETVLADVASTKVGILTGPAIGRFADRIPANLEVAPPERQSPLASSLLPMTRQKIDTQDWEDPDTLEPLYLRRSYAEEKNDAQ